MSVDNTWQAIGVQSWITTIFKEKCQDAFGGENLWKRFNRQKIGIDITELQEELVQLRREVQKNQERKILGNTVLKDG